MMGDEILSLKAREALRHIRNWTMHHGKFPSVRELMNKMEYKSPRSATLILEELEENGFIKRKKEGGYRFVKDLEEHITRTVAIPLVGSVACGSPLMAEENIEAMIQVSLSIAKPGSKYFLLRANGDSMNQAGINSGDLLLIKQQTYAENGQQVVALIDDEATVKELQRKNDFVMLLPRSDNPKHQPIILTTEFQIQGIVIAAIPIN